MSSQRAKRAESADLTREEFDEWLSDLELDYARFARIIGSGYDETGIAKWDAIPKWVVSVLKLIEIKPEVADRVSPRYAAMSSGEFSARLAALGLRKRGGGLLEFAVITGMRRASVRKMRDGRLPIFAWAELVIEYLEIGDEELGLV